MTCGKALEKIAQIEDSMTSFAESVGRMAQYNEREALEAVRSALQAALTHYHLKDDGHEEVRQQLIAEFKQRMRELKREIRERFPRERRLTVSKRTLRLSYQPDLPTHFCYFNVFVSDVPSYAITLAWQRVGKQGIVATAWCSPRDNFSRSVGRNLAHMRLRLGGGTPTRIGDDIVRSLGDFLHHAYDATGLGLPEYPFLPDSLRRAARRGLPFTVIPRRAGY